MGQLEELMAHRQSVESNIEKSFGSGFDLNDEFEKARSGVYTDNAENRRLKRVGQKYGTSKVSEQGGTAPQGKNPKDGKQKPEGNADSEKLANFASGASDAALKRAMSDKNASPEVKAVAEKEVEKRKNENKKKPNNPWAKKLENVNIPVNVIEDNDFDFGKVKWNHYGNDDFGFAFAGYKDTRTGELSIDIDDTYGLEPEQADAIREALEAKFKKQEGKKEKPRKEKKDTLNNKVANSVEKVFMELEKMLEDEDEDEWGAIDKFNDKISDLVIKDGLTEDDFYKIKHSNPSWKYGLDVDWGDIEEQVKEKKENERDKRYAVKSVIEGGINKKTDAFMDENTGYFRDILEPYDVRDLFELQGKLEEEHEDDEKDPYGYKEYSKIYVKCLKQIPADEFKNF